MASAAGKKVTAQQYMELELKFAKLDEHADKLKEELSVANNDRDFWQALLDDVNSKLQAAIEQTDTGKQFLPDELESYIEWSANQIQSRNADDDSGETLEDVRTRCDAAIQILGDAAMYDGADCLDVIEEAAEELSDIRVYVNGFQDKITSAVEATCAEDYIDLEDTRDYIPWSQEQILDLREKVERIPNLELDALSESNRADTLVGLLKAERALTTQLRLDNAQFAPLQGILQDRETTISQQMAFITNTESSISSYKATIQSLESQLSQNNESTNGLDGKYQAEYHRIVEQHNAEMGGLRAEVGSLRQQLEEETISHERAMRQKEQEKAVESSLKDQFTMEKTGLENAVSTLRDEISTLKAEKEGAETKSEAENTDLKSRLMKLYNELEQSAEAKTQLQSKHDTEMKAVKESIAQLESQCMVTGEAEPSIIATIHIRRLETENKNLRDTKGQLQEIVAALKKEYKVQPGKLYDIMNVQKNSNQWRKEIRKAEECAISAKEAQQKTMELNRGLNQQVGQLISENRSLKVEKESLERGAESKSWEIARSNTEISRQSKEITRLSANLGVAERKAQLLQKHHEGIGGTEERLAMAIKEINDKQANFDDQTKKLESARLELKRIQDREYAFLTSEEYAVKTNKQIDYLKKENWRLVDLSQSQRESSELDKKLIARLQSGKPLVIHTPPSTPAITRDTVLKLMREPDHILPRLSTATSLSLSFSPIVTVVNIQPVVAECKEANDVESTTESGNNEDVADAAEPGLFLEADNNDVDDEDESRTFPKWQVLFFVLTFIGTMMSWAMDPPKTSLPRGDVCEMFEKPLEQSGPYSVMVCAGSADDYANLSLHDLNVRGGSGFTWQ